jgi:beta-lactamase class A
VRSTTPLLVMATVGLGAVVSSSSDVTPLAARLEARIKGDRATVALYAKNLRTAQDVGVGADRPVRTASTIKLPILCALESLVAAGTVKWDERVRLRTADKISGSGILADLEEGTELSIRNLATLMIIVSDNTATNLVLDRITADAVNDYLDTIGLTETRALRKVRGDVEPPPGTSGMSRAGRLEMNQPFGLGKSTAREMVRLLEALEAGRIVSPAASADILAIMKRQQIKDGIGRHTADGVEVASKSGALDALRSDVGLVWTSGGPVALAITVDDLERVDYSPDNAGNRLISDLTALILTDLGGHPPASAGRTGLR